ncbi:hypothetical protein EPN96_03255 [bacterium]|nr:MAG: hypothetical protein EPN96_03255 [bacterium]
MAAESGHLKSSGGAEPSPPRPYKEKRRFTLVAALIFFTVFLTAFVPYTFEVFEKARKALPSGPARFRVLFDSKPGILEISTPGSHYFLPERGDPLKDPGIGGGGGLQALWRALDFFSRTSAETLEENAANAGVDLSRRGLARLDRAGDKVAVVIGARGEGEPGLSQLWFDRDFWRLRKVVMGDGSSAEVKGYSENGWPKTISTPAGDLEILGPPEKANSSGRGKSRP